MSIRYLHQIERFQVFATALKYFVFLFKGEINHSYLSLSFT